MSIMRGLLLWGSRNPGLRRVMPRFGFVRRAVGRFMPGEDVEDALNAAEALRRVGIAAVLTHLGENVQDSNEAQGVMEHYVDVLERIQKRGLDCQISLKLTQLGLDLGQELCAGHLERIANRAKELGNFVWIDMESSAYVDRTLDLFKRIRTNFSNVGVCLQSYLYRTAADLDALKPLFPSIRLVKGAYAEPGRVAFRSRREVDENFFALAARLLDDRRGGEMRVGIATHDLSLLHRVHQAAAKQGISNDAYEIQMLYGIQREHQADSTRKGYRVRVLISYGAFWFPWYMRRLAERPANVLFVLKNVIRK